MFLPSEERQSTAALAPIASLPSILVSESMRNLSFSGSFLFKSRVNSASPTEVILPDTERISAAGVFSCGPIKAVERPTASVKQTRKNVANESAKRNHIYGTNLQIEAQADSQSGRKNATARENLKNEQHNGDDEEKARARTAQ